MTLIGAVEHLLKQAILRAITQRAFIVPSELDGKRMLSRYYLAVGGQSKHD